MIFAEVHINLCLFWHKERVPTQVSTGGLGGSHPVGGVPPQKKFWEPPPKKKTLSTTQKMSNSFIFMQLSATFIPPRPDPNAPPPLPKSQGKPWTLLFYKNQLYKNKGA